MKKYLPYILIIIILAGIFTGTSKISAAGQCLDPNGNPNTGITTEEACVEPNYWVETTPPADPNTNYNLLQPLPAVDGGDAITKFPVGTTGALGKYLNLMIKLIIGLCAVAAVVMIVVGGIQWSASELISGKEDAKQRIWNAVLGLILALCSWLILYTINPDLLNTEVDIGQATLVSGGEEEIESLVEDAPLTASESRGEGLKICTQGLAVSKYNTKKMCKDIVGKYDELILAAKSAGLTIIASGYRCSKPGPGCVGATQQGLRDKYHCPNATTMHCDKTVAPVGSSRHENGLAFDVLSCTVNGVKVSSSCNNSCMNWLRDNSSRFGFFNKMYYVSPRLNNDCVHWSTDGF